MLLHENIASPLVLLTHEYRTENMLKLSSASSISVSGRAALTVGRRWSKIIGSIKHVLAQQLWVGDLVGKLLIQLVIDELLYPCTYITGKKRLL